MSFVGQLLLGRIRPGFLFPKPKLGCTGVARRAQQHCFPASRAILIHRTQSTVPTGAAPQISTPVPVVDVPPGSAPSATPDPVKPPNISSRIFEYFGDHPWHLFGPLLAVLIGWLVRSNVSSSRQDEFVKSVDSAAPLHAREVTAIGRDNALTLAEWQAAMDLVFAELERRAAAAASPATDLLLRASDIESAITRARTVAQEGWVEQGQANVCGTEGTSAAPVASTAPLQHAYMLRRAAAWRTGVLAGTTPPLGHRDDGLAKAWSAEREASSEEDPPSALRMPALPSSVDGRAGYPLEDSPLPALALLFLYSSVVGGRTEVSVKPKPAGAAVDGVDATTVPLPPPVNEVDGLASPSQRLNLTISLLRRWAALQDWRQGQRQGQGVVTRGVASPEVPFTGPPYTLAELSAACYLLGETHALPTRNRARATVQYPFREWALAPPARLLADALKELDWKLETLPLAEQRESKGTESGESGEDGAGLGLTLPPSASEYSESWDGKVTLLSLLSKPEDAGLGPGAAWRLVDAEQARKIMLASRSVCAWGDCYNRYGE